jgi:hypothetical protein
MRRRCRTRWDDPRRDGAMSKPDVFDRARVVAKVGAKWPK